MKTISITTVAVDPTTPTALLTTDQVNALQSYGIQWLVLNPSVDIVIVGTPNTGFPDTIQGTVANSPTVIHAGAATPIQHRSGNLHALSTSGTATVKISLVAQV